MPSNQDQYTDQEADRRRDEILRRLLRSPPKQQQDIKAQRAKQRKRCNHPPSQ